MKAQQQEGQQGYGRILFSISLEEDCHTSTVSETDAGKPHHFLINASTSNEALGELLRLEFDLADNVAVSLITLGPLSSCKEEEEGGGGAIILPVQTDLLDNGRHYLLRVYRSVEEDAMEEETHDKQDHGADEDIWETYTTKEGKPYYYNKLTKQSSWHKSVCPSFYYYINRLGGVTHLIRQTAIAGTSQSRNTMSERDSILGRMNNTSIRIAILYV